MNTTATEVTVPAGTARAAAWFFENTLDIFVAVQGDVLKASNGRWTGLLGWSAAESLEKPFFDFVHVDDLDAARQIIAELPFGERTVIDLRLKSRAGAWFAMETQVVRGQGDWLLMILRDVTAERQREADAEEALQAAILLQEAAGIVIWRYNPETDEYDVDPDFTRSGRAMRPFNRWPGADVRQSVHRDDGERLFAAFQDSVRAGASGRMSYRTRGADGGWRRVQAHWRGVRRLASGQWELLGVAHVVAEAAATPAPNQA